MTTQILDRVLRISPLVMRVCRYVLSVVLVTHLLSCIFWLLKVPAPPFHPPYPHLPLLAPPSPPFHSHIATTGRKKKAPPTSG